MTTTSDQPRGILDGGRWCLPARGACPWHAMAGVAGMGHSMINRMGIPIMIINPNDHNQGY